MDSCCAGSARLVTHTRNLDRHVPQLYEIIVEINIEAAIAKHARAKEASTPHAESKGGINLEPAFPSWRGNQCILAVIPAEDKSRVAKGDVGSATKFQTVQR